MQKVIPKNSILIPDTAKKVFDGVIFDVYQWDQKMYDGTPAVFEMLKRPDTVVAITVVDDEIIVLEDEQPNRGMRHSNPGGRTELTDTSALGAVKREVLEETGYTFKKWRLIDVRQEVYKIEWFVHVFLAWDVDEQTGTKHDAGEKIEIKQVGFTEYKKLVNSSSGTLGDCKQILKDVGNIDDLLKLPDFEGKKVDR